MHITSLSHFPLAELDSSIILGMPFVLWTLEESGMGSLKENSTGLNTFKRSSSISIRWLSKKYYNQFHKPFIVYKIKWVAKLSTRFFDWNKKLLSFSKSFCKSVTSGIWIVVVIYFVYFLVLPAHYLLAPSGRYSANFI